MYVRALTAQPQRLCHSQYVVAQLSEDRVVEVEFHLVVAVLFTEGERDAPTA
jgi:hypothetical protein